MSQSPYDLEVLYRDEHLLVVAKPVGIATTAPEGGPSLFSLVQKLDAGAPQLHPLSRLDTQVSGIVAFARTELANRVALDARREGRIRRRYVALATVAPTPRSGEWTWSIALDARDARKRRALAAGEKGSAVKHALTRYAVRAEAGPLVLLDLWPHTGRTHQLRVHAAKAGSPLAGDVAYGGMKRLTLPSGRILTASRVMLHCAQWRMPNPARPQVEISCALAPPEDLCTLWHSAGGAVDALLAASPA